MTFISQLHTHNNGLHIAWENKFHENTLTLSILSQPSKCTNLWASTHIGENKLKPMIKAKYNHRIQKTSFNLNYKTLFTTKQGALSLFAHVNWQDFLTFKVVNCTQSTYGCLSSVYTIHFLKHPYRKREEKHYKLIQLATKQRSIVYWWNNAWLQ